jgi:hypothetical protein
MPGQLAFLLVDQVAVLLWDGLGAVLDLVDLTGPGGGIEYYHVELTNGELQDENLFLGVGQLGFQQYNTSILRQKRRIGCGSLY